MTSFDLPNFDDCYGKNKPCFLNQMGLEAKPTDFASLVSLPLGNFYESSWFTNPSKFVEVIVRYRNYANNIMEDGSPGYDTGLKSRYCGLRPIIKYSDLLKLTNNHEYLEDGVHKIKAFRWMDNAVGREDAKKIIANCEKKASGFIIDNVGEFFDENHIPFKERYLPIYNYNGKEYVIWARTYYSIPFLNRYCSVKDFYYCFEVNDVVWLVDIEKNIAMTEKVIMRNIEYEFVKEYMNKYLFNEFILQPNQKSREEIVDEKYHDTGLSLKKYL